MKTSVCLSLLFLLAACHPNAEVADTAAPTARKPSYFESDKRQAATPVKTQTPALPAIRSRLPMASAACRAKMRAYAKS